MQTFVRSPPRGEESIVAKVVGGFGSSHSPLMSLTGELWAVHAQNDIRNRELVQAPSGKRVTSDELLAEAERGMADPVNTPEFDRKLASIPAGLDEVKRRFTETKPDVVAM